MQKLNLVNAEHRHVRWAPPEVQAGGGASSHSTNEKGEESMRSSFATGEAEKRTQASEQIRETGREYGSAAMETVQSAKERGESMLEESKRALANEVGGIERALRRTASELEREHQRAAGRYAERAANSLEQISHALREQDLDALIERTEDFARREPGVFLGGAVAAGFLLTRFLKSSGRRVTPLSESSETPSTRPTGYRAGTSQGTAETAPSNPQALHSAMESSSGELQEEMFMPSEGHAQEQRGVQQ